MDKWICICLVVLIGGMFAPVCVSEYAKGQCRTEAIHSGYTSDDILKLCK